MENIPEDVLTRIFTLALDEEEQALTTAGVGRTRTALTVSAVNRHWRQIGLSYPLLWRLITIQVNNLPSSQPGFIDHFVTLGKREFRLHLMEFVLMEETWPDLMEALMKNDLHQNIERLCIFPATAKNRLFVPGWDFWDPSFPIYPLNSLHIADKSRYPSPDQIELFPPIFYQAKHVYVKGGNFVFVDAPATSKLVTFHLDIQLAYSRWICDILQTADDLRHLTVITQDIVLSRNPERWVHSNLEHLSINFAPPTAPPQFSFPSLRRVEATQPTKRQGDSASDSDSNAFWTKFEHPEQIKEAGMWIYWPPTDGDIVALTRFTAITQLTFRCFSNTISETIQILKSYIHNHFPSLVELRLCVAKKAEVTDDVGDLLVQLLSLRNSTSRMDHGYLPISLLACDFQLPTPLHKFIDLEGIEFQLID
jgi:hypothetical protein